MSRRLRSHALAGLLLTAAACGGATIQPPDHALGQPIVIPSNGAFAGRLHAAAAAGDDNALYSPTSIAMALAMTREGARGRTADEMDAVLGKDAGANAQALIARLRQPAPAPAYDGAPTPPTLAVANRLFADPLAPLLPAFVDITASKYLAPIEPVDFAHAAEPGRVRINAWVAEATRDKIMDLLAPGTVDASTRLVLVNALYLKAQWATAFQPSATAPAPFAIAGGDTVDKPTMHGLVGARWGALDGARMLDLPYSSSGDGPRLGMLLVVPNGASLHDVEASYAAAGLPAWLAKLDGGGEAQVSLPTFTVERSFSLGEALGKMGMPTAFTDDADFSGISAEPLEISDVIHKAWAKIDEAGTEAAAATAVIMRATSAEIEPRAPYAFDVDRSFLAFIHDEHGEVLFAMRIVEPMA